MPTPIYANVARAGTQAHVPDLMYYTEASAYLGISEKTLKEWKSSGFLPAYLHGHKRVVFKRADLDNINTLIPPSGKP